MPASPPHVVWTQRAQQRLEQALTAVGSTRSVADEIAALCERLAGAFPEVRDLIVLDLYLGFRPREGQHILLADVQSHARLGTCIIKIGTDEGLRQEWEAWLSCRQPGFEGNAVLMKLEPRYYQEYPHRFAALVYQDAQQHIGADEIVWLENAVTRSARFGSPDPHSLIDVIRHLFGSLGRTMYKYQRVEQPAGSSITLNHSRATGQPEPIAPMLEQWAELPDAIEIRQQVNMSIRPMQNEFCDPVDYFNFLEGKLADKVQVLPKVLRGRAHGDLHGRNVLVGVEQNRALLPALYDYEHMRQDNLIAWDFVKLETELKIRVLEQMVPLCPVRNYSLPVFEFERELIRQTYHCRESNDWPHWPASERPMDRLTAIILSIREQACHYLGTAPTRPREWLHEYLFMLAAYGLVTVRYRNQTERQRAAAFISAGVAAAEYEGGRREINEQGASQ